MRVIFTPKKCICPRCQEGQTNSRRQYLKISQVLLLLLMIHDRYTDKTDLIYILASKVTDIKINKLPLELPNNLMTSF